jgi:hypothetical protein
MRARSLFLAGTIFSLSTCSTQSAMPSREPPVHVLRPASEEYRKLRGQWRGAEVGRNAAWTFSFDDTYMVVVTSPDGEWYQGLAGLHYELGRAADGTIRVPPGSGVVDVDVFGSSRKEFDGETSLGAYYLTGSHELKLCASQPGVYVRALSYDVSSPTVRCFRLAKTADEPSISPGLPPVEKQD